MVGSGEIILTSSLGAIAGFGMLWWVLLSCWSKSIVQAEFARYVMTTGDTYIRAMNRIPGRIGPVSWTIWLGMLAFIPGVTSMAGIVGGSGQAIALLFPAINDVIGAAIVAVVATLILGFSTYRRLEFWLIGMVISFTACTLICAIAMQTTRYGLSHADIVHGLSFEFSTGVLLLALSVYGYTGVKTGRTFRLHLLVRRKRLSGTYRHGSIRSTVANTSTRMVEGHADGCRADLVTAHLRHTAVLRAWRGCLA